MKKSENDFVKFENEKEIDKKKLIEDLITPEKALDFISNKPEQEKLERVENFRLNKST